MQKARDLFRVVYRRPKRPPKISDDYPNPTGAKFKCMDMKRRVLIFLLFCASSLVAAETQLFANFNNPLFEQNRKFIERIHERFMFDVAVIDIFIEQTKGPILNSMVSESACVDKLGGGFVLAKDLTFSQKYQGQLKTFFESTDGPRKAKIFSGILLGTLDETERADLSSIPSGSRLINRITIGHFISTFVSMHQSAFLRAAENFFNEHCPR